MKNIDEDHNNRAKEIGIFDFLNKIFAKKQKNSKKVLQL